MIMCSAKLEEEKVICMCRELISEGDTTVIPIIGNTNDSEMKYDQ